MDKLKDFINTHREAFEDDLLTAGHFERFGKKLPEPKKRQKRWIGLLATVAAAVIACLVILEIYTDIRDTPDPQSSAFTCETQKEIDELRLFYNMQMNEMFAQIRTLYKREQVPGGLELLEETKKVIKISHDFEDNILPTLPCSDAGLFAMTQHYSTSLQSLNIMLKQMEQGVIENRNN